MEAEYTPIEREFPVLTSGSLLPLRRLDSVYFPPAQDAKSKPSPQQVATLLQDLAHLGYGLTASAVAMVEAAAVPEVTAFVKNLWDHRGEAGSYRIFHVNFPQAVAAAPALDLYLAALKHYQGAEAGTTAVVPVTRKLLRGPLRGKVEVTLLEAATEDHLRELAQSLVTQGVAYSSLDRADLVELEDLLTAAPVPVRENLAFLAGSFPKLSLDDQVTTVTDVLRLATVLSGGEASLEAPVKFKLSRGQRRRLLKLLERVVSTNEQVEEDFARHSEAWKRLAHCLHHREFASLCPAASARLSKVQSDQVKSLNSRVETLLIQRDLKHLLPLLKSRPGVFSRRLQELLRAFPQDQGLILKTYEQVAGEVAIPALLSLWTLSQTPDKQVLPNRVALVKGAGQKVVMMENRPLPQAQAVKATVEKALRSKSFSRKVYTPEDPGGYAMPLQVRNASEGMTAVGRGSRIPLGDQEVIRLFLRWMNRGEEQVDLDLSAVLVTEDLSQVRAIAYYNLREQGLRAYHSGDIVDAPAPRGASEFIDVDREAALAGGYRYLVPSVYSYSRHPLATVPQAAMGFMLRDGLNSGEVYEPSTVKHSYPLTQQGVNALPWVIDLATGEALWWDQTGKLDHTTSPSLRGNEGSLLQLLKAFLHTPVVTVADLLALRGVTVVDDPSLADLVIDPRQPAQALKLLEEE